jgi:hypothetical protein
MIFQKLVTVLASLICVGLELTNIFQICQRIYN